VAFTWTDLDENGKPQSDPAWCVMRRESNGWRVVGVALTVFEGEPPLLLNFENPTEVLKKQEWLRQELARRSQQEKTQETKEEKSDGAIRR
jgi:hypothetical protein